MRCLRFLLLLALLLPGYSGLGMAASVCPMAFHGEGGAAVAHHNSADCAGCCGGIEQINSFCQSGQGCQLGLLADLTPEQRLDLVPVMATFAPVRHRALLSPLFATIWRPPA